MRFESLEELIVYFVKGDKNVQDYDIELTVRPEIAPAKDSNDEVEPEDGVEPAEELVTESTKVRLTGLNGLSIMEASIGDENILYVDSYEAVKDYCGTGKINVFGKTLVVNMCEMNDVAQTQMSIDINGVSSYNVDFKLRLLSEKPEGSPVIQLKEVLLDVKQV